MKKLPHCKLSSKSICRTNSITAFLCLLLISGNLFSQNNVDDTLISTNNTDTTKTSEMSSAIFIQVYDTIPRFYNRIWNIGFGFAFPIQDFHSSDPQNKLAGYALQGLSFSVGLFSGFSEGSEAGWYFGAAYSSFNTAGFIDSLQVNASRIELLPSVESGTVFINEDYRPRYQIFSFSTGFAFEGSDERVSAYGSLLINANFTRVNSFRLVHPSVAENKVVFPFKISNGFSAKFGLRFQQQFSIGLGWHYLGRPDLEIDARDAFLTQNQAVIAVDAFGSIPGSRRINFLEVNMSYAFVRRGGYRAPQIRPRF